MSHDELVTHRTNDLVVGVDGTPASANAVRYAMSHAERSGGKVEVFHVVQDNEPMGYPIPFAELMDAGRVALESTLRQVGQAGHLSAEDRVTPHLERGGVVKTLVAAGRRAQAIVVGSDRRSLAIRLLTGNVSTGLASRATVPVVSVPESWSADRVTGVVVAGVKDPAHSTALMAEAFDVARRSNSRLVVLHVWRFPAAYDDLIVADRGALAEWSDRSRREIEGLVEPMQRRHPDVEVELRVVHDYAANALVGASKDADELVVARRAHAVPAAATLGSTARTVLLHSDCPVRVVPPAHVPMVLEADLEADGAALTEATH